MTTFRTKSANTYKRYTPVQLASTVRQLQKQFITVSKMPTWKFAKGKSAVQQCNAISSEIRKVAGICRTITVQQINGKIRTLKTQMAFKLGVKVSSPKASSTAVKRLKAKIALIKKCKRVTPLINLCTGVKLSTYKNPVIRNIVGKTKKSTKSTRRTTGRRTRTTRTTKSTPSVHKYKRQAHTLKKQVHKLQRRNSFMRRLVNQFRRKVAKLQRSYRAANARPRWKARVIHGKGTSNVVRFNRTSTVARQRRVG